MLGKMHVFTETSVRSLPITEQSLASASSRPSTAAINLSLEELLKSLIALNMAELQASLRQEFAAGYTVVSIHHNHAMSVLEGHVAMSLITTMTVADHTPE
ncbi:MULTISPECIES: hypothetical protein [Herpetosiphon]|uniref:hypothetical protein n=1 Tax=Herpetosiphon TaxID=64 RepID=UPI0019566777|nr:hypothetical protein [Herpetosiphon giganteus]MBM7846525.1 hypothetical protein [Herpetosiphon giganteus]